MDLRKKIEELKAKAPKPRRRASHGQWTEPAWCVRGLVEAGQPVTDAARLVVQELCLEPQEKAVEGVRQAYYAIKDKPWPDEAGAVEEPQTPEVSDDFIV